jgi:hypothetical protein
MLNSDRGLFRKHAKSALIKKTSMLMGFFSIRFSVDLQQDCLVWTE